MQTPKAHHYDLAQLAGAAVLSDYDNRVDRVMADLQHRATAAAERGKLKKWRSPSKKRERERG